MELLKTEMSFLDTYPLEIGIFIIVLTKILILIEVITTYKTEEKSEKFLTWKKFFKNYLFLILMLVYGIYLIFKNI